MGPINLVYPCTFVMEKGGGVNHIEAHFHLGKVRSLADTVPEVEYDCTYER